MAHLLHRQTSSRCDFPLDLFVDRAPPASARSWRCSSTRCKARFKKSISSACCPILRSSSPTRSPSGRMCPEPKNPPAPTSPFSGSHRKSPPGVTSHPPRQPRRRLPSLHTAHRRQLELSAEPPLRHTDPPSLNSIGELVVSKLGSTPRSS